MRKTVEYIVMAILLSGFYGCRDQHRFNDTITLNRNDKIPYGTYAAYHLLQKEFPQARIETNRKAPPEWENLSLDSSKQVLLIVTKTFDPTEEDLDFMTGFVQKGNYIFISALQITHDAARFFKIKSQKHFNYHGLKLDVHHSFNPFDSTAVSLDSFMFTAPFRYQFPGADFTNGFTETDSAFTYNLGYSAQQTPNLIALSAINGTFYLHSAPISFTNMFVLYRNNVEYFEKLMSLLPDDAKKIVWDEYYLYNYYNENPRDQQSILSVILKYQNFRWAFWSTLLLLALYLFTEARRRQRLIPNYAKPKNDSLEFVTTVGKLYYEQGDHKNLADKLTQYFLDHVRNHFKLSTAEINYPFEQQLAAKANKNVQEIQTITAMMHAINLSNSITQQQLMQYYELLEQFYKTT